MSDLNFKSILDVPVTESTENINLIVNENGNAKQIPANKVGAQADWEETDETSPAFIMNKPKISNDSGVIYVSYHGALQNEDGESISSETFIEMYNKGKIALIADVGSEYPSYGTVLGYNEYFDGSNEGVSVLCAIPNGNDGNVYQIRISESSEEPS